MKFYLALAFLLVACGVEKMPEQMEKMQATAEVTNDGMERSNENIERLLDHCFDVVFTHDIVSPYTTNQSEIIKLPIVRFNLDSKEKEVSFLDIPVKQLTTFFHIPSETAYYLVPLELRNSFTKEAQIRFPRENSLCTTINDLVDMKIDEFVDQASSYMEDSEDVLFQKIADALNKIEKARIDCSEYETNKAIQAYEDSQIKFWQFKQKKELKLRLKKQEISNSLNQHPCEIKKKNVAQDKNEIKRLQKLVADRWESFHTSWSTYYELWLTDKKYLFNNDIKNGLLQLEIEDVRLKTLYQIKAESVSNKLKLLDLAKPFFPINNSEKLRKFLASNESGMRIDPEVVIDYMQTPLDRIDILRQIFIRYFYSGNTKDEKKLMRDFITDAIFMLYEQQIIEKSISSN